jgi:hypothetical protein
MFYRIFFLPGKLVPLDTETGMMLPAIGSPSKKKNRQIINPKPEGKKFQSSSNSMSTLKEAGRFAEFHLRYYNIFVE